ncbi:MAG: signal peptide peptidase SppA [Desulfobacterales bacterium]
MVCRRYAWVWLCMTLVLTGCVAPSVSLFPDRTRPFQEVTLEGSAREKVLLLVMDGVITDMPRQGLLRDRPSPVQEVVARLRRAEKDPLIKAVVLKINSPGGTVTGSDILYHELSAYKEKTGVRLVAAMMDVAASGGYYVSLPADRIIAHPTTVTGSVGVLFLRPKVTGLIDKIGVGIEVNKSGENKDMGSPFRAATADEALLFQELTDRMGERFITLLKRHRRLSEDALQTVRTARVFLAEEAKSLGLVDSVGYLQDAVAEARSLGGLTDSARLIVYRRDEHAEDTIYNTAEARTVGTGPLVNLGPAVPAANLLPGFYYLWLPGIGR